MNTYISRAFVATFVCVAASGAQATSASLKQASNTAQTATAQAISRPYALILDGSAEGMTCDGDTSLQADGNTVDTDALVSMINTLTALPGGGEISLPMGQCEVNQEIDIPTSSSIRFSGGGIGLTNVEFFSPSSAVRPVQNGLVFDVMNSANLTIDDFTISRRMGANRGSTFSGTAVSIIAAADGMAGNATVANLSIMGPSATAQTDGWSSGLLENNIPAPVINNVSVHLPGWATMPNPNHYMCMIGPLPTSCAIHALPSPTNPISTPANLDFGVGAGVALGGINGSYQIDSVINGLSVTGGLTGLDLRSFQGAYVTNTVVSASAYGIRADTLNTTSELLAVSNSSFSTAVGGIFTNGVGGIQVTGNSFSPSAPNVGNLPVWTAIWSLNDNDVTIQGNNVTAQATSLSPDYGFYESSGDGDGFPIAITGNTLEGLSSAGSVCLGNDAKTVTISASGNTLIGCSTNIADLFGSNGYADNTLGSPDELTDATGATDFPQAVQIGTFADPGTLSILENGSPSFSVDSSGDAAVQGTVNGNGMLSASGSLVGSPVLSQSGFILAGNPSHYSSEEVVGGRVSAGGGSVVLAPASGGLSPITSGFATLHGEVTCSDLANNTGSWHVIGHYVAASNSVAAMAFLATPETDDDSAKFMQEFVGSNSINFSLSPNSIGLQVIAGSAVRVALSCTSDLHVAVNN